MQGCSKCSDRHTHTREHTQCLCTNHAPLHDISLGTERIRFSLRRVAERLTSSRRPYVARQSLRGLSWPFSPPRVLWPNASWVKPYWSAAAYVVSQRGGAELMQRYRPQLSSSVIGLTTIDTTSQRWPAADQVCKVGVMPLMCATHLCGCVCI